MSSGCLRKSLTVAVSSCSCTSADSSSNVSRKCSSCSSALSMRSAYSPMIQIILACRVASSTLYVKHPRRVYRIRWRKPDHRIFKTSKQLRNVTQACTALHTHASSRTKQQPTDEKAVPFKSLIACYLFYLIIYQPSDGYTNRLLAQEQ